MVKVLIIVLFASIFLSKPVTAQHMSVSVDENPVNTHEGIMVDMGKDINLIGKKVTDDTLLVASKVRTQNEVKGDLIIIGDRVVVDSLVHQDLRVVGRVIEINGEILGNVSLVGGEVKLGKRSLLHKNVTLAASTLYVEGKVEGLVTGVTGTALLNATVASPWKIWSNELALGEGFSSESTLTYHSPHSAKIEKALASVGVVHVQEGIESLPFVVSLKRVLAKAYFCYCLVSFGIGLFILHLSPKLFEELVEFKKGVQIVLRGLLITLGILGMMVLSFTTIVGIPLGFILLSVLFFALFLGQIVGTYFLGRKIGGSRHSAIILLWGYLPCLLYIWSLTAVAVYHIGLTVLTVGLVWTSIQEKRFTFLKE
ncbi:MAG: hypothetical protein ACOX6V_03440 [Patescibacteria group bacterium]|jgi:hypothetical protein